MYYELVNCFAFTETSCETLKFDKKCESVEMLNAEAHTSLYISSMSMALVCHLLHKYD